MLFFKDSRDWLAAVEIFGIHKVRAAEAIGDKKAIGIGRCIDGAAALERLRKNHERMFSVAPIEEKK